MRDVHPLAVDEHRPSRHRVAKKDARVRQPALVGVGVLINVPQQHEKHERGADRGDPQQPEVGDRSAVGGRSEVRKCHEQNRIEREPQGRREPGRVRMAERRDENPSLRQPERPGQGHTQADARPGQDPVGPARREEPPEHGVQGEQIPDRQERPDPGQPGIGVPAGRLPHVDVASLAERVHRQVFGLVSEERDRPEQDPEIDRQDGPQPGHREILQPLAGPEVEDIRVAVAVIRELMMGEVEDAVKMRRGEDGVHAEEIADQVVRDPVPHQAEMARFMAEPGQAMLEAADHRDREGENRHVPAPRDPPNRPIFREQDRPGDRDRQAEPVQGEIAEVRDVVRPPQPVQLADQPRIVESRTGGLRGHCGEASTPS